MAILKTKFRTIQEEFFEPEDHYQAESAISGGNGKFIAVVAVGFVCAASLGTILSFAW